MAYDIERGGYGNGNNKAYQGGFGGGSNRAASPYNGGGGGSNGEDSLVAAVTENVRQMSANVGQINKFVQALGTNRDGQDVRDKLSGTIETTKILARDITGQLKQLGTFTGGTAEQRNQSKIIHQKLAKDFGVWLQKFQEISKLSAHKERTLPPPKPQQQSNKLPDTFPQSNGNYDEYTAESEKQSLLEANNRKQQLMQLENDREFNDAIIREREMGIKQIETAVVEVNEIFTDLANLVHEQGFMIDNIESNIETTAVQTQEAVVELQKASKHQRSARSKMCILAIIITVIAAALTLILVLTLRK